MTIKVQTADKRPLSAPTSSVYCDCKTVSTGEKNPTFPDFTGHNSKLLYHQTTADFIVKNL